jgi:phenylacetate-CoA ligase
MPLNSLRHKAFWLMDGLKGGKINNNLNEVKQGVEQPNSEHTRQRRAKYLKQLLSHASTTTEFYNDFKNTKHLEDYPVIRKTVIQDNFDAFRSSSFINANNYKVSTSGSTGVPFFLFQDKGKRQRNHADVIYFAGEGGYKIGNRLYELEVWRSHNKKGKIKSLLQNIVQFDISRLTDERIEQFLGLLKSGTRCKKSMLGFASAYEMIAQYLDKKNITLSDLGLIAAIANSEYLNPYTKSTLGKRLNTLVLSRYSSEEIGIIAQQTIKSPNNFVLNHASYHIELLNFDNDSPVMPGEFGRIVVTDLFNYAMPIIRYDTGDIAQRGQTPEGIMTFEHIEGRKMDLIYDTNGNVISSFVVYTKFYKYYQLLKQYQFIQQGQKDYEIKLNLQGDSFAFENELIADVKSDFGADANVYITYVDEIPALASGKRRKVVNNYKTS